MRALPIMRTCLAGCLMLTGATAATAEPAGYPNQQEADFLAKDFRFATGESLPEVLDSPKATTEGRNSAERSNGAVPR